MWNTRARSRIFVEQLKIYKISSYYIVLKYDSQESVYKFIFAFTQRINFMRFDSTAVSDIVRVHFALRILRKYNNLVRFRGNII